MPKKKGNASVPTTPKNVAWQVVFFQRHRDDDPQQAVPGRAFLEGCPDKVRAMMLQVLLAVRDAPPPAFSGGGKWEAMHDEMAGFYEVRVDGPNREHFRLFCILEQDDVKKKLGAPSIVVIAGTSKAFRTVLSKQDYERVRRLGDEYLERTPRCLA